MSSHQAINQAFEHLYGAIEYGFDAPKSKAKDGPLKHLQRVMADLDWELMRESFPAFSGSWLEAFSCQEQGVPVAGQVVKAAALPKAAELTKRAASDAEREVLAQGKAISLRPPAGDVLVVSPTSDEACVYQVTEQGVTKLAGSIVDFVVAEVTRISGTAPSAAPGGDAGGPPVFLDGNNYAVVIAGRRLQGDFTVGVVRALRQAVADLAVSTGLPLAAVYMGESGEDAEADQTDYGSVVIGLVTAWMDGEGGNREPAVLAHEALSASALERIPTELWELVEEHGGALDDEAGVFLASAGWTVASIFPADATWEDGSVEGEPLVTTCSEDDGAGVRIDDNAELAGQGLLLWATYA
ncbi:MAG: hypothetical protein KIT72_18230 [Polyangiaceae bacterium]|nr:hypothetical protein [Polyangiaceae bacterium]MCW5792355.1 hypothetical protein [Polyangiaceae bacterium]